MDASECWPRCEIQQRNGALLQEAGTDAAQHIVRRLALQNHVIDAV